MADEAGTKLVVSNRRARYEFQLSDFTEAGLVLTGSEVKSMRAGKVNLQDAFAHIGREGLSLMNCHIAPYEFGGYANHEPTRPRRLLLHRSEIAKFRKGVEQKGYTIIPTKIYFKRGRAKVELALGKGKKLHDKRHDIAEREASRRVDRIMKGDRE